MKTTYAWARLREHSRLCCIVGVCENRPYGEGSVSAGGTGAVTAEAWPILRLGDDGDQVATLQAMLAAKGFAIPTDGHFDVATDTAVKEFQQSRGLQTDGVAGPRTWQASVRPLTRSAASANPCRFRSVLNRRMLTARSVHVDCALGVTRTGRSRKSCVSEPVSAAVKSRVNAIMSDFFR